ncbi:MAG: hypothetical protein HWN81_00570 [Candidatus Lokiarchaeota archaeon]|nr:hypothetical protein [Candidatus Lokiarchaeota archaeon]
MKVSDETRDKVIELLATHQANSFYCYSQRELYELALYGFKGYDESEDEELRDEFEMWHESHDDNCDCEECKLWEKFEYELYESKASEEINNILKEEK